ncbi:sensor histidine kinase [Natronosalvus vescus]|uniref:sensor histidine kinase n=1 Tax=Natronosalvus vescus TaxID=2953881 RepID=UPI0020918EF4|nr:ATP-binding protein [Natronosalvus vescus]
MSTIQLLIDGDGNREAIRELLAGQYEVLTEQSATDADLYIVDDTSFPNHYEHLSDCIEASEPVFCPVILIRRTVHMSRLSLPKPDEHDGPLLVDDIVDAPVDQNQLFRRINTLLIRRNQSAQLQHYVSRLEESNARLEQFAYAASHDLQEPLRMVTSYLQLIESRYGDEFDEDGEEFLEFAIDGADRMRSMIEGLLEYSRVDTEGNPLKPTDMNDVVEDVRMNLEMKIDDHEAQIEVDSLPVVNGDEYQLRQLLQNVLSNAIEYSGDEPPRIRIAANRNGTHWKLSVTDNGIGIDPDDQDRIFEVFQRLHSRDEHPGTGIGLALCKRIIERHGGDIWVDSEPGEGSTVTFTLPPAEQSAV